MTDFSHLQDVFGNVPMVKRYTLLSLFFTLDENPQPKDIEATLRHGLDRLSASVPHLAGHVIFENKTATNHGKARILPLSTPISLTISDLRNTSTLPPMSELINTSIPISHLKPSNLVPEAALPLNYTSSTPYLESSTRPARVLALQATLIQGGIILTFASNHTTMDMNGLGQTICLLAKTCRGEPLTDQELSDANQDRQNAVPLLPDDYVPGEEARYFTFPPAPTASEDQLQAEPEPGSAPKSKPKWANISFSPSNLARLKSRATSDLASSPLAASVPYISTNDVLSAFFWQQISLARSPRLAAPSARASELNRQLSARRLLGLSDGYQGHMTASTHTHLLNPHEYSLGHVAACLRRDLSDTEGLRFSVRAMATALTRLSDAGEDTRGIGYGATLDPNHDLVLSSYAEIKVCQVSFGSVLGQAVAARRPDVNPFPCIVYVMPKDRDGGMTCSVCLRGDDMAVLRGLAEFREFAEYIG